ncbi:MAG: hypothetical protein JWM34_3411 [Ilumatobacteraceae bacterium]|nr:hypothetical protein [Ilumatobacteraceae bacterium]
MSTRSRLVLTAALAAAALGGTFTLSGAGSPANATATCAQGGICALGDTGPGGGIVFFVKGTGAFSAQRDFVDPDPNCAPMCQNNTVAVSLTSPEQADLPFDYLEVAPAAAESPALWSGGQSDVTGADASLIGTGTGNSAAIAAAWPSDPNAAEQALAYSNNGLDDWFLPSYDELSLILIRAAVDGTAMGTFASDMWSSTQNDSASARALDFDNGQALSVTKNTTGESGRPLRAFSATPPATTTTSSTTTTVTATTTTVAATTTTVAPTTTTEAPATTTTTTTVAPTSTAGDATTPPASTGATSTSTTTSTTTGPPSTSTTTSTAGPGHATSDSSDILALGATTTTAAPGLTEAQVMAMPTAALSVPSSVTSGQQVTVHGDDLPIGLTADVYIASDPVYLASGTVRADGSVDVVVTIPSGFTGQHSLVLAVPGTAGARQSIEIAADSTATSAPLPTTGTNAIQPLRLAIVLVLIGIGCVLIVRRRRADNLIG